MSESDNYSDDTERDAKAIRYNVPNNSDAAAFDAEANFTLHVGGITIYFDRIREEGREGRESYVFVKYDADVAFVPYGEWDVSPTAAKAHAELHPGEKVRFADPREVEPESDRNAE